MADTAQLPSQSEPQGTNWLEEVKRDAEYNYKKQLALQQMDKEHEAAKQAGKK